MTNSQMIWNRWQVVFKKKKSKLFMAQRLKCKWWQLFKDISRGHWSRCFCGFNVGRNRTIQGWGTRVSDLVTIHHLKYRRRGSNSARSDESQGRDPLRWPNSLDKRKSCNRQVFSSCLLLHFNTGFSVEGMDKMSFQQYVDVITYNDLYVSEDRYQLVLCK